MESSPTKEDGDPTPSSEIKNEPPEKKDRVVSVGKSTTSTIAQKPRSCCYRFWDAIFKFFAHDSIYGSLVGPHPVSFLWFCCKGCCKKTCVRPFALASVATKLMWFLMLIVIIILSCFFIIPYSDDLILTGTAISDFYPCGENRTVNNRLTRNCDAHGGYFMVYRNFCAFILLLLISCFIMINVKSTGKNRKRAKMHHGFWMYKYIILFVLLLITYCAIRVEGGGIFEFLMSLFGLAAVFVFSFVEITFLLDLVELFCEQNRNSESDWADCLYWSFCGSILFVDCTIIVALCYFYGINQYVDANGLLSPNINKPNTLHCAILAYTIFLTIGLLIFGLINLKRKLFKYTGFLQTSCVIFYLLIVIWTGLGNSPEITARPPYNYYKAHIVSHPTIMSMASKGNFDTYFKPEPFVHTLCSLLALAYYVFWNAPRSTTAPMSVLFNKFFFSVAKKSEVPVVPVFKKKTEESPAKILPLDSSNQSSSGNANAELDATATPNDSPAIGSNPQSLPESTNETPKDDFPTAEKETQKDDDPEQDYANCLKELKVWDDEKTAVRYSWTMFYVFMILGSLSIMMGMTNLSDPWAHYWHSSSYYSMGTKLFVALTISMTYIFTTTFPCPRVFAESCKNLQCSSRPPSASDPEKGEGGGSPADVSTTEPSPPTAIISHAASTASEKA